MPRRSAAVLGRNWMRPTACVVGLIASGRMPLSKRMTAMRSRGATRRRAATSWTRASNEVGGVRAGAGAGRDAAAGGRATSKARAVRGATAGRTRASRLAATTAFATPADPIFTRTSHGASPPLLTTHRSGGEAVAGKRDGIRSARDATRRHGLHHDGAMVGRHEHVGAAVRAGASERTPNDGAAQLPLADAAHQLVTVLADALYEHDLAVAQTCRGGQT